MFFVEKLSLRLQYTAKNKKAGLLELKSYWFVVNCLYCGKAVKIVVGSWGMEMRNSLKRGGQAIA